MGKKRVIKKSGEEGEGVARVVSRTPKKKVDRGILYINATYNNTTMLLSDVSGNTLAWSSSGSLGYKGAKKGTPFAASKVAEVLAEKAQNMGIKDVDIVVKGVGAGRESAIRSFTSKGFTVDTVKDATPVPFNGPKPPKPRRV
jgi:small subunit ribosomal protein S11